MSSREALVLVWAPLGRDADLAHKLLLRHGIRALVCRRVDDVCAAMTPSVACAVLTEECLSASATARLARALVDQPPWSDLPFVVFRAGGAQSVRRRDELASLGNVTLLDRPVKARIFLSAVESALRARQRQYQARDEIVHRDQFLAMLGHELRNPLSGITLAAEVLRDGDDDDATKPRAIIERQAKHLTRLVDDLLDVSRVTSDKITLQRAPVDLRALVTRAAENAQATAAAKRQTLTMTSPQRELRVDGDAVRLEQVFNNLLHNAIKYTQEGGQVRVEIAEDDGAARVAIVDDGIGISGEMLPRIFDLFTQVGSSIARSQGGLGVGLTVVRRLVELHGGTVSATSAGLGRGSTFSVRLPLLARSAREAVAAAPTPAALAPLRVVFVDDNADVRELSTLLLRRMGCEVTVGHDGPSGLAEILAQQPDVAFVDIGLPILDGYQVARQARAALPPGTKLVAVTGYGQPEDRARALDAGFDEHLTKPVEIGALRALLSSVQPQRRAG